MSYTLVHRTPLDVAGSTTSGLEPLPFEGGLFKTIKPQAVLESPALESPVEFDDLVASWNAAVPEGAQLQMQASVRIDGIWSEWFTLGRSEGSRFHSVEKQENPAGFVAVDTLKLKGKAAAFRYRFLLSAPRRPIILRLAAVTVSDATPSLVKPFARGPWTKELKIFPRSQTRDNFCSPTSLAMDLSYWGYSLKTAAVAEKVRDASAEALGNTDIFGDWPFNTAAAGNFGLESYVARLNGLEDIQSEIAQGRPVIVSLTFAEGELSGAPLKKTNGHLLLVSGFTASGDVITLDPAAPADSARRVYKRLEFHKVWLVNKRGLAYLIGPLKGRRLSVGTAVADLMAAPRQKKKIELHDPEHLSQLLYGETVIVRRVKGDWVLVEADQQPALSSKGDWRGYAGWVAAGRLHFVLPPQPNAVIRTRQALLHRGPEIMTLSVGTELYRTAQENAASTVRLTDGSTAEMLSDALYVPPAQPTEESRSQIIKTAELFLGTSYYWGGTSGVQPQLSIGVDCSGLVHLAYRIHGLNLPRNSHEQKLRSRPVRRGEMKAGDLVFLTDTVNSNKITHVMIYTGGDGVIESRKSSGRVLRSSFQERFSRPLSQIESGDTVVDSSLDKPRRRLIYFGSYF